MKHISRLSRKTGEPDTRSKRTTMKIQVTPEERKMIEETTKQQGFDKPRDFIVAMCSGNNIYESMEKQIYDRYCVEILPMMTTVNQIRQGVNEEENKTKLVQEVCDYAYSIYKQSRS
jgi:hypothetical protein